MIAMNLFLIKSLIILCLPFVQNYKILGVFPGASYSHFTLGFALLQGLANQGHDVTFITCVCENITSEHFRTICVKEITKPLSANFTALSKQKHYTIWDKLEVAHSYGITFTTVLYKHENIEKLMNSDETFDLVILEQLTNEAMVYFAHKFNCPLILFAPGPTMFYNNYLFGNIAPPSFVTSFFGKYGAHMNFWQRLTNTYYYLIAETYIHLKVIPEQNRLLKEAFPDAPDLNDILYNASLLLTATHPSFSESVPLQQNIKQIGGFHMKPPQHLPEDIKEFMDNANEGVIVFSMGSIVTSANIDSETRDIFLNVFSKMKQKVIWKFDVDIPHKPANVKIFKWFPQADVLAHPNVKVFISHCGLLGTTEAIHHGVPILGLPIYWDHFRNINSAVTRGFAVQLDFYTLTENMFQDGLEEIINNPKYMKAAKEFSAILQDNPVTPLEEAIFWCEYVIRHKGAPHLRSVVVDLPWYSLYMIDIILFVIIFVAIVFIIIKTILGYLLKIAKVRKSKKLD